MWTPAYLLLICVQDGSLVELMACLQEEGKSLSLRDILTIFLQVRLSSFLFGIRHSGAAEFA